MDHHREGTTSPVQYVYGLHAVDSLLRKNPARWQRLLGAAGARGQAYWALLELARTRV